MIKKLFTLFSRDPFTNNGKLRIKAMTWISSYTSGVMRDVITNPCYNTNEGSTKVRHRWVTTSYMNSGCDHWLLILAPLTENFTLSLSYVTQCKTSYQHYHHKGKSLTQNNRIQLKFIPHGRWLKTCASKSVLLRYLSIPFELFWAHIVWSWWCHQMEIFSALLALCDGNSTGISRLPPQRPVGFAVFFDLRMETLLSKQSRRWWFETPSRSLWRHCSVFIH